jgi:hypothetical protein
MCAKDCFGLRPPSVLRLSIPRPVPFCAPRYEPIFCEREGRGAGSARAG